eukprot:EG_transcript_6522
MRDAPLLDGPNGATSSRWAARRPCLTPAACCAVALLVLGLLCPPASLPAGAHLWRRERPPRVPLPAPPPPPATEPTASHAPRNGVDAAWPAVGLGAAGLAAVVGCLAYRALRRGPTNGASPSAAVTETQLLNETPETPLLWKKLVPLAVMGFAGIFNYTLLANTKDVLIVTAPRAGAEALPFLKTYVNLPGAVLWTVLLTHLSNRLSQAGVFSVVVAIYMLFFVLFTLVLYPARDLLHPEAVVDQLADVLPPSFMAPLALLRYWTFSLYYVMGETWGTVVVATLTWSLANQICTVEEAKRYYPILGFSGNIAPVFAGQYSRAVSTLRAGEGGDHWNVTLYWLTGGVVVSGLVMLACCYFILTRVLPDARCVDATQQKHFKQRTNLSVLESTRLLVSSPYLRSLALLVVCYGLSLNIVDTTWKSKLRTQYPDPNAYSAFMGAFSTAMGLLTLTLMVLSRYLLCHCSWGFAAGLTPVFMGATGLAFFSVVLFPSLWAPLTGWCHTTPLMVAVLMGAAQGSVSKSSKWALFDPCKNMAYIPLDPEARIKGKAAIDVIGGPLGKSGGAFLQQGLILGLGSLSAATPCLGVCLTLIIGGWLHAVHTVSRQFDALAGPPSAPPAVV